VNTGNQYILDLRGVLTSMGLLKASRKFQVLEAGATLIVECDDEALGQDILNILDPSQIKVASCDKQADVVRLCIVKQDKGREGSPPLACSCGP